MSNEREWWADGIEIVRLTGELTGQATQVLVEAFKTEETTAYHLDTGRPATQRRMAILDGIFLRMYLEADRPILAAVKEGRVVGVGMVRDPRMPVSGKRAVVLFVPHLPQLLALFARHPIRLLRVVKAARCPKGLAEPFFTFEALGVHPGHQGEGAGKALMRAVQAVVEEDPGISGIYLNTGSAKNQAFYESLGYGTLRIADLGAVKVYHMFWRNPAFG
ncbi:MAG: GNAT family N-acetyltransferase [Actinobacteria bacterium]|jgi:GNAT superfamily N-acetyltransferase|nr:MAG: GNAT family N-acetyltransferase [Actinomycetota bacterium]